MHDIRLMVSALFRLSASLERAWRRIPAAATLSVLQAIAGHENMRPSDIAADLLLHPSSVSRHVQTLQERGFIEIHPDPADGRSCFITLTSVGTDEIDRLTQIGLERFASFVAGWDDEEVRMLGRLLIKLEESKNAAGSAEPSQTEPRPTGRSWQVPARASKASKTKNPHST